MTGNVETQVYTYDLYVEINVNGLPYGQMLELGPVVIVIDYDNKTVAIS